MEYDEISHNVFFSSYISIIVTARASNCLYVLIGLENSDLMSYLFSIDLLLFI
jgi:hypothetical protein